MIDGRTSASPPPRSPPASPRQHGGDPTVTPTTASRPDSPLQPWLPLALEEQLPSSASSLFYLFIYFFSPPRWPMHGGFIPLVRQSLAAHIRNRRCLRCSPLTSPRLLSPLRSSGALQRWGLKPAEALGTPFLRQVLADILEVQRPRHRLGFGKRPWRVVPIRRMSAGEGDGNPRVTAEVTTAQPQTWSLHKRKPRSFPPTSRRVGQGEPGASPRTAPGGEEKGSGTRPRAEELSSLASPGSPAISRDSGTTRGPGIHVPRWGPLADGAELGRCRPSPSRAL